MRSRCFENSHGAGGATGAEINLSRESWLRRSLGRPISKHRGGLEGFVHCLRNPPVLGFRELLAQVLGHHHVEMESSGMVLGEERNQANGQGHPPSALCLRTM